jgi:c-di-GMP-related signal transduction protein
MFAGLDDRPPSLYIQAMTRARMCEQLGRLSGANDCGPFFITGLFSLLGALVGMPTQKIVEELPLSAAVTTSARRRRRRAGRGAAMRPCL